MVVTIIIVIVVIGPILLIANAKLIPLATFFNLSKFILAFTRFNLILS